MGNLNVSNISATFINSLNASIMGNLNVSNISSSYINGLNASLFIGTNAGTTVLQIGNSGSTTSIFGNFNISNISATFINSLNASIMGNLNVSNISATFINSLNASIMRTLNVSNISATFINSLNASIIGNLNVSNISSSYINGLNASLFIGTNAGTKLINIGNATTNTSIIMNSPIYLNYVTSNLSFNNIGHRFEINSTPKLNINLGLTTNMSIINGTGFSGQTPAGIYLFEVRITLFNPVTANTSMYLSTSLNSSDTDNCITFPTLASIPFYTRLVTTVEMPTAADLFIVSSSNNGGQLLSGLSVVRTRLG